MKTKKEIFDFLIVEIKEFFPNNQATLTPLTDLKDIGFDSLDYVTFLIDIECEFGMEFEDERLIIESYQKLQDLIDYIYTKIS